VSLTRHTYCSLLIAEIGGHEVVDTFTGKGVAFKCVAYDPFDERFSCCKLSLEPSQTVTELNSGAKDEIKTCGDCGRVWCFKEGHWATLVRVDGLP
jgi:hypothetical protein